MSEGIESVFDLCVVIVNYNGGRTLRESVVSVLTHSRCDNYVIIVVDNGSSDGSLTSIRGLDKKIIIAEAGANLGFGGGNNYAFRAIKAQFYYLHNSDAYLQGDSIGFALKYIQNQGSIGILGFPLIFPNGTSQSHAYTRMSVVKKLLQCASFDVFLKSLLKRSPLLRNLLLRRNSRFANSVVAGQNLSTNGSMPISQVELFDVDWVCGASMLISLACVRALNGFDEDFFLYYEDEDLCLRAQDMRFRVVTLNVIPIIHDFGWGKINNKSPISKIRLESARLFVNKHFRGRLLSWVCLRLLILCFPHKW